MDKEFNTTFIPKQAPVRQQLARAPKKPVGAITALAVSLFVAAVISLVGVYLYEQMLAGEIRQKKIFIADAVAQLDQEFLSELKALDSKLQISKDLLDNHRTVSSVLKELEKMTIPALAFGSFDFSVSDDPDSPEPSLSLDGMGLSFRSLAQQAELYDQSDLFTQSLFSDFTTDDDGFVSFSLGIDLDENARRYLTEAEKKEAFQKSTQESPFERGANSLEPKNDVENQDATPTQESETPQESEKAAAVEVSDAEIPAEDSLDDQTQEPLPRENMEEDLLESSESTDQTSL
jgi:hypothetical protein